MANFMPSQSAQKINLRKKWAEINSMRDNLEEIVGIIKGLQLEMETRKGTLKKLLDIDASLCMGDDKRKDENGTVRAKLALEEVERSYEEVQQLEKDLRFRIESAVLEVDVVTSLIDNDSKEASTSLQKDSLFAILGDQIESYKKDIEAVKLLHRKEKDDLIHAHRKEILEVQALITVKDTQISSLNERLENATKNIQKVVRDQSISDHNKEATSNEITSLREENKALLEKLSNTMIQKIRFPDESQITSLFNVLNDQLEANKRELDAARASHRQDKADWAVLQQKALAELQTIIATKDVELVLQGQKLERFEMAKKSASESFSAEQQSLFEKKTMEFKDENDKLKAEINTLSRRMSILQTYVDSQKDSRGITNHPIDQLEQARDALENEILTVCNAKIEAAAMEAQDKLAQLETEKRSIIKSLEKRLIDITRTLQERDKDVAALKKEVKTLSMEKRRLEEDNAILIAKSSTNDNRVAELLAADDRRVADRLRSTIDVMAGKLKDLQKRLEEAEAQAVLLRAGAAEGERIKSEARALQDERDRLQFDLHSAEEAVRDLRQAAEKQRRRESSREVELTTESAHLRSRVEELSHIIDSHGVIFRSYEESSEQTKTREQTDLREALKKVDILEERLRIQTTLQAHLERELKLAQEESSSLADLQSLSGLVLRPR